MSDDGSVTAAEIAAFEFAEEVVLVEQQLWEDAQDLTAVEISEREPWVPGCEGMWHVGVKGYMPAPRSSGKSLVATIQGVQVVEKGGTVVYLDLENGVRRMARRMETILADRPPETKQAVSERFHYFDGFIFPQYRYEIGKRSAYHDGLLSVLSQADIVYVDSWARALGQEDLDEDRSSQVSKWIGRHVDSWKRHNPDLTVIILDNTGHGNTTRGRGASGKEDLLEVCYLVTGGKTCKPDKHGEIRLELIRWRDGDEAQVLAVGAGAGKYGHIQPTGEQTTAEKEASDLRLRTEEVLVAAPEPMSKRAIAEALRTAGVKVGQTAKFNESLDAWVLMPNSGIEADGKRFRCSGITADSEAAEHSNDALA